MCPSPLTFTPELYGSPVRSQVVLSFPQTVWKPTCLFSHLESPALLRLTFEPIIITI